MRCSLGNRLVVFFGEQFLIFLGLQLIFLRFFKVVGVTPYFFLIWVLYLGWYNFPVAGILGGFVTGLIYDAMVQGKLGWSSLILVVIAYVSGFLPRRTFGTRVVNVIVFSIVYSIFLAYDPVSGLVWEKGIVAKFAFISALYNVLVVCALEWYLKKLQWREKNFLAAL